MIIVTSVLEIPIKNSKDFQAYLILKRKDEEKNETTFYIAGLYKDAPQNVFNHRWLTLKETQKFSQPIFAFPDGELILYKNLEHPKKILSLLLHTQGEIS